MQRNLTPAKCAQRAHKKWCLCVWSVCLVVPKKRRWTSSSNDCGEGILVVFVDVVEVLASCCCCGGFFCYSKVVQAWWGSLNKQRVQPSSWRPSGRPKVCNTFHTFLSHFGIVRRRGRRARRTQAADLESELSLNICIVNVPRCSACTLHISTAYSPPTPRPGPYLATSLVCLAAHCDKKVLRAQKLLLCCHLMYFVLVICSHWKCIKWLY